MTTVMKRRIARSIAMIIPMGTGDIASEKMYRREENGCNHGGD